ncbi:hypothetical protein [Halobacteriovorax sp. RT-2-2]|uniref:hypothetical protein n=1 Tax=Halobacteriovorax sp. RT-2-2 TaxID=3391171 RepID=UPI0039A7556E
MKNFIDCSETEVLNILDIRNSDFVRNMMWNRDVITLSSHLSFLKKLINNDEQLYWAVFYKDRLIGSVYIDMSTKKWGMYLAESCSGFGLDIELYFLLFLKESLLLDKVYGEVKLNNIQNIVLQKIVSTCEEINEDYILFEYNLCDYFSKSKNLKEIKRDILKRI